MPLRTAWFCLFLLPGLAAEAADADVRWQLPIRSAAVYARTWGSEWSGDNHRFAWHRPHNPPVLLDSELDKEGCYPEGPIHDLRDLPAFLAFDLRHAQGSGRMTLELGHLRRFTRTRALVHFGPLDDEGGQTIFAVLSRKEDTDEDRRRRRFDLSGLIRIERTVDAEAGRVVEFDSRLEARLVSSVADGRVCTTLEITERWTFEEVLRPTDAAFRKRVDDAIRRSAAYLRDGLARASYGPGALFGTVPPEEEPWRWRGSGYLALVLLALLKAEHDPADPPVAKALDVLRKHDVRTTYSLACAILAMEALYAPRRERERLIAGELDEPPLRQLSPGDLALVRAWTQRLLENRDTRVDLGYLLRWRYYHSADYDNSNTQYANLGLYSAHLCGVRIPLHVWLSSARHWLADIQEPDEDSLRLRLTTHAEVRAGRGPQPSTRTVARRRKVAPRGWGYGNRNVVDASMTAAGITGLTVCRAALGRRGGPAGELRPEIDRAIDGGRAWLARYFHVRAITGKPHGLCSRHYYFFGVERAMELAGIAHLQDRDWYFEGAIWLLGTQEEDGRWEGFDDTAFGLLFLKKAVLPVVTPRR